MNLHAPDPMGKAAFKASQMFHRFGEHLLVASSPSASREERAEAALRAFSAWPKICRAMAALEDAAPNAARAGRDADAKTQDFIEGAAG